MLAIILEWAIASLFLFLQSTLLQAIALDGVVPNLGLIVILIGAYHGRAHEGAIAGFLAGFTLDLLSSSPFGYHSFMFSMAAWSVASLQRMVKVEGVLLPTLLGALGSAVVMLSAALLGFLFGPSRLAALSLADRRVWIEIAYNAVLTPILLVAMRPAIAWMYSRDRRG